MTRSSLTKAQRVALAGLDARGGKMVVTLELDGSPTELRNSAAALACLQQCIEPGYVKHTMVTEASGLWELTPSGRFHLEMSRIADE